MRVKEREAYKSQAAVLKVIANDSRLIIVHRLHDGPCAVGELVKLVGSDQSTVSKHLAVLRATGIVADERRGNTVVYRLVTPCVVDFLDCASRVLRERRSSGR